METPHVEKWNAHDFVDIYGDIMFSNCFMTIYDESYYSKWTCEIAIERGKEYPAAYGKSLLLMR